MMAPHGTTNNGCPVVRRSHLVVSPTHNGFGNQAFGLEKALWVAWALNRSLILPPLLRHSGPHAFNAYPRCGREKAFEAAALRRYGRASNLTRWTGIVDFGRVRETGLRVVDYADARGEIARAQRTTVACGAWDVSRLRAHVNDTVEVAVVGSTLRMDLAELRRDLQRSSCGWKLLAAAHAIPFRTHVRRFARVLAQSIPRPYAALHLRSGDAFAAERTEAVVAAVVLDVAPRLRRFRALYVSYDLPEAFSLFQTFLAAICGGGADNGGDEEERKSGGGGSSRRRRRRRQLSSPSAFNSAATTNPPPPPPPPPQNCSHVVPLSLESLLLMDNSTADHQTAYDALLARHGDEFARIALDQQIAALAADLFLSDGAHHTFRRTSSFGRLLRRRWNAQRDVSA